MLLDPETLKYKILEDTCNLAVFSAAEEFGYEIYIVGGYLRDAILGKKIFDRDYVVKGNLGILLKQIVSITGGRSIQIGKKDCYRITLGKNQFLDFMPLDKNIGNDVSQRDFTINSLAWSPEKGIIDCYNGIADLSSGLIKMIRKENLSNDPVRIIRAYRLSGDLSFSLERETRTALKRIHSGLKDTKSERITLEFFKILNHKNHSRALKMMLDDGILGQLISLSCKDLYNKLKALDYLNQISYKIPLKYKYFLEKIFSQNLTYTGLLRLQIILSSMPETLFTFSSAIAGHLLKVKRVNDFLSVQNKRHEEVLFDIFRIAGKASPDYLIINNLFKFFDNLDNFIEIDKKCFLSAEEILKTFRINKGEALGKTIEIIKKAQFYEKINTKKDAIDFLKDELGYEYNLT